VKELEGMAKTAWHGLKPGFHFVLARTNEGPCEHCGDTQVRTAWIVIARKQHKLCADCAANLRTELAHGLRRIYEGH
jgi:hypothetical protein